MGFVLWMLWMFFYSVFVYLILKGDIGLSLAVLAVAIWTMFLSHRCKKVANEIRSLDEELKIKLDEFNRRNEEFKKTFRG